MKNLQHPLFPLYLFLLLLGIIIPGQSTAQSDAVTIVIDASDLLDEIPSGHRIIDASQLEVPWLFNNTGLLMTTRSNYLKRVEIPVTGTYYLYARSHGRPGSTIRVAIGEQVIPDDLGNDSLRYVQAGTFELAAGTVNLRVMRIENNPILDVLVLSQDPEFTLDDLKARELDEEVTLLREYRIPPSSCVKFGDLTGDGQTDLLVLSRDYSAQAFDFSGQALWSYTAPEKGEEKRRSFEAPGLVWDLDQDGDSEVIHWRQDDEGEWLTVADGRTGAIIRRCPWPTEAYPHEYNNFRLAIGRLTPGYPRHILAFTDMGGKISVTAYDPELREVWQHVENKKKDHLGHYLYPIDLDQDGTDEVVVGTLVLDGDGTEIWNAFDLFFDHHDHADSYRFADLDQDGKLDMVSAHSEIGVFAYGAMSGKLKWQNVSEHAQQLEIGNFLQDVPGPQIAVGARTYGNRRFGIPYLWSQVHWFDPKGKLIRKWPANPLNGNPVFIKGDWRGDGKEALFWFKFRLLENGTGKLYFGEPVYHMFDFMGGPAEEVITLQRDLLRVYGYKNAPAPNGQRPKTPDYLQARVANHTHY
ncbi:hypothetical protein [Flavilitoribacter nigricans]|uniref:Rhamnogalacturonan I lyase beta-sheet domain-containing protein n=1 Tax=Flavilitoribacter nigricans (strain ATCC 23147 / DSM 23189 / NBRC 102662 / NCIMB 1420 / SS-2) TaxID=1122177 RepID=A0A2D0NDI6_FLAN2|nr:hypothetical protein [Flavilitoribacter nigricans]PHN06436.1 hypothetical protein CRP01_12775 [Flavilitoribacter nigricans DSM 23189 = NBRC 102662]